MWVEDSGLSCADEESSRSDGCLVGRHVGGCNEEKFVFE